MRCALGRVRRELNGVDLSVSWNTRKNIAFLRYRDRPDPFLS
jgi:hypothetical protein